MYKSFRHILKRENTLPCFLHFFLVLYKNIYMYISILHVGTEFCKKYCIVIVRFAFVTSLKCEPHIFLYTFIYIWLCIYVGLLTTLIFNIKLYQ